jgi:hypothetical protein
MQIKETVPFECGNFSDVGPALGFAAAELIANNDGWMLRFTFPGPDRRYNPQYVTVYPNEVRHLRTALVDAMNKYLTLKPIVAGTAEITEAFGHVTLRVGGWADGVCLGGHHVRLRDSVALAGFLTVLSKASVRGTILVGGLRKAAALRP